MDRRHARKSGQRQQSERKQTIRVDLHDPPDLDKLSERLIRMVFHQSGSCRSGDATRPKRPHDSADSPSQN